MNRLRGISWYWCERDEIIILFGAFFWCAWNIINLVVMVDICVMSILLIVDCFQKDDIDCFNVILQCGLYWNTFTVRVHIHWTIWFVCTCICLIFFKDIFKYPLIIKVPFYFAIISWHALVFCSLSRHWYLRSQSLTSWMIHTPKVKCSKDPDCHRRCGIFTKIIFTCWKNFQDTGMY